MYKYSLRNPSQRNKETKEQPRTPKPVTQVEKGGEKISQKSSEFWAAM